MKQDEETKKFMTALGDTVKRHRIRMGLTQGQLATLVGSESKNDQRSFIAKIEKGERNPDAYKLAKIANALNIPPTQLLNEAMQIQEERKICELFEQCYGKESFMIVKKFLKLDSIDQAKIAERIDVMLEADKYQRSKADMAG